MPKKVRVNVRTRVNNAMIVHEKRDGRDVIRVPSATLPDNVVMNRILYPAEEIAKSFKTLEGRPAPLGHPMVGNQYVSALHPQAINGYWIGAWNENVRRENGRVYVDKIIDVEVASRTEKGKQLLDAINQQQPIHTSTGIFLNVVEQQGSDHDGVAHDMLIDHDAILLNQVGAATPQQGVGLMVNAKGETEEVEALDVDLDADDMEEIAESIARSVAWRAEEAERENRMKSLIDKVKGAVKSILKGNELTAEPTTNGEDTTMPVEQKDFDALKATVDGLAANAKNKPEWFDAALKPFVDKVDGVIAANKAAEEAERTTLVDKVVRANMLDEDVAKTLEVNALRNLASKIQTSTAQSLFGSFVPNSDAANKAVEVGSIVDNLKAAGGDK
jgi:hypothetical protein